MEYNIKLESNNNNEINNIKIFIHLPKIINTYKFIVSIKGIYYNDYVDIIDFIGKNTEKLKRNTIYKKSYILILLGKVANNVKITVQFTCMYSKQLIYLGEFIYLHNFVNVLDNIVEGCVMKYDDAQNFYMSVVKPIEEGIIDA